ncbi:hypothetical protein DIPPA_24174 [Diplonema papillatum]|nr:hypothetical protein DIPPA_24174 [Diplonema papillatum]|eukprot:gene861-1325_t
MSKGSCERPKYGCVWLFLFVAAHLEAALAQEAADGANGASLEPDAENATEPFDGRKEAEHVRLNGFVIGGIVGGVAGCLVLAAVAVEVRTKMQGEDSDTADEEDSPGALSRPRSASGSTLGTPRPPSPPIAGAGGGNRHGGSAAPPQPAANPIDAVFAKSSTSTASAPERPMLRDGNLRGIIRGRG